MILFGFVYYLIFWYLIDITPFSHLIVERVTGYDSYDGLEKVNFIDMILGAWKLISDPHINVRLLSFKHYFELCMDNPFGLGVNYFPRFAYVRLDSLEPTPPDSILDTFVHGGIGLFLILIFFVSNTFKLYIEKIKKGFELNFNIGFLYLGFCAAFVANLVVILFGGFPIYSLKFWILSSIPYASLFKSNLYQIRK